MRRIGWTAASTLSAVLATGLVLGACSSTSSTATSTTKPGAVPSIATSDFTLDFSAMAKLKGLAAKGKGLIGVILPETTTSARYTAFDAPYLQKALTTAGLSSSDFKIDNAQGSDATKLNLAQSDITAGASVLIMDPIDSGVGASIESYAASHGVPVIDYDRLTLGGSRKYYVSFDNVKVGQLIGQGFVDCVKAWNVTKPNVLVMRGAPTDNNATLFYQGYMSVLKPYFDSGQYVDVAEPAGTWDPPTAQTEFTQQLTAHPNINSVVMPNDATATAVISQLKTLNIPPHKFPVTGQDAQVSALQNILAGYQCGTVYKPIYLEAQAAVALALYLRAGDTPPSGLVNGTVTDTGTNGTGNTPVPSVLLTPIWVTTSNMAATVVKDKFVSTSDLCSGSFASLCTQYGIS